MQRFIKQYWVAFEDFIEPKLPASVHQPSPDLQKSRKWMFKLNAYWFVLWVLLPLIALENDFIDILENIIWGSHFQFGYDKNPYFGAWLGHFGYWMTGGSLWVNYVFSQIFVIGGFAALWKLGRRMLSPAAACLAVILLWGITFYGMKATELGDDVMELGIWPILIYVFYCALRDGQRTGYWLLTGVFSGLALMTKYYALVLFISMGLVLLFSREGRQSFRHKGIYLSGLVFLLLSLPNFIWLYQNDFVAVDYAMARAGLQGEPDLMAHLRNPLKTIERVAGVIAVPLVIFALLFFRRSRETRQHDAFDRTFLHFMALGPFVLTLLFSLISGSSINYSWVLPCFGLLGIYCFYFYQPKIDRFNFRIAVGVMLIVSIIFGGIFLVRSAWHQSYRKRNCDYENFPGKAVSIVVADDWRRLSDKPLPYVIAERKEACNVAIYSSDQPKAFFSANIRFSQWINPEDIVMKGGAIVWEGDAAQVPQWFWNLHQSEMKITPPVTKTYPRATPAWVKSLLGEPKTLQVSHCFIIPQNTANPKQD